MQSVFSWCYKALVVRSGLEVPGKVAAHTVWGTQAAVSIRYSVEVRPCWQQLVICRMCEAEVFGEFASNQVGWQAPTCWPPGLPGNQQVCCHSRCWQWFQCSDWQGMPCRSATGLKGLDHRSLLPGLCLCMVHMLVALHLEGNNGILVQQLCTLAGSQERRPPSCCSQVDSRLQRQRRGRKQVASCYHCTVPP